MPKEEKQFYVYMMASQPHGTLYTGITSRLIQRGWQHKEGVIQGFTERYDVKRLVWYEMHQNAESAIHREKRLKKYKREQKIRLIETDNPEWNDLYDSLF